MEEDQEVYRTKLDTTLKKKFNINAVASLAEVHNMRKNLDELWNTISGCIIKCAYKMLPNKEIKIRVYPLRI